MVSTCILSMVVTILYLGVIVALIELRVEDPVRWVKQLCFDDEIDYYVTVE